MKAHQYALAALFLAVTSTPALAAFAIHSSPKTDHLGSFTPYEEKGQGAFRHSDASNEPRQARYEDAELMLDLAYSPISHRGTGVASQAEGFAEDVPFASGMSMIIPRGWHLYRDSKLNNRAVPQRITFNGGRPWPDVLSDLGQRHTLHFHIDWYDRTVMMSEGRPLPDAQPRPLRVIAEPEPAAIPPTATTIASTTTSNVGSSSTSSAGNNTAAAKVATTGSSGAPTTSAATSSAAASPAKATSPGTTTAATTSGNAAASVAAQAEAAKPVISKPTPPPVPTWRVQVADKTYREALARWARTSGWTFEPEHWTVSVDIPLTAAATFRGDFKSAVQSLISTTELSETPLQPCFYSNQVVRIVPYNEVCDRALAR